jgi:hypothetical protein
LEGLPSDQVYKWKCAAQLLNCPVRYHLPFTAVNTFANEKQGKGANLACKKKPSRRQPPSNSSMLGRGGRLHLISRNCLIFHSTCLVDSGFLIGGERYMAFTETQNWR